MVRRGSQSFCLGESRRLVFVFVVLCFYYQELKKGLKEGSRCVRYVLLISLWDHVRDHT